MSVTYEGGGEFTFYVLADTARDVQQEAAIVVANEWDQDDLIVVRVGPATRQTSGPQAGMWAAEVRVYTPGATDMPECPACGSTTGICQHRAPTPS